MSDYRGYDLFTDTEDEHLRTRNRAVCMWNIFEQENRGGKVNKSVVGLMAGYFASIPEPERHGVLSLLTTIYADGGTGNV